MSYRAAIPLVVAATFLAGFGAAELTGVRAVGGLVLLAGGAWCARATLGVTGPWTAATLVAVGLALFVASHPLGNVIGAWPAVAVSAALVAVAAAVLVGRRGATPPRTDERGRRAPGSVQAPAAHAPAGGGSSPRRSV
jgi:hypothetical protein